MKIHYIGRILYVLQHLSLKFFVAKFSPFSDFHSHFSLPNFLKIISLSVDNILKSILMCGRLIGRTNEFQQQVDYIYFNEFGSRWCTFPSFYVWYLSELLTFLATESI